MRIRRLDLRAYGPFTGRVLEFDCGAPGGLHVVFGPNEAGKSSALRGLKALLYGFPERCPDNFQHASDQLLVGGVLQRQDGAELAFWRRKRRKADLLDAQGQPLEPAALAPFLLGLEPAVFAALYGIDHETLVQGGEDILAQRGEVGQALFSAGAGIAFLRQAMAALDGEAEALFKPRGSKQELNQALAEYQGRKKLIKEASLSGRQWLEHQEALKGAQQQLDVIEKALRENNSRRLQLERLRQAAPLLARRRELRQRLAELAGVRVLPADFHERRQALEKEMHAAGRQYEAAAKRLALLAEQQQAILLPRPVLDQAESIEDLHQRLGGFRKAMQDRPRLEGLRSGCRDEAAELLGRVRPDLSLEQIEALQPVAGRQKSIQQLGAGLELLAQKAAAAGQRVDHLSRQLAAARQSLAQIPETPDATALLQALELARKAGDLDSFLHIRQQEAAALEQECRQALQRLGRWAGSLEELNSLRLPLAETISRFADELQQLAEKERELRREQKAAQQTLERLREEMSTLTAAGSIPTEADLREARGRRDQGWQRLRREWIEGGEDNAAGRDAGQGLLLADSHEQEVAAADQIADRLRREADRIHRFAALTAQGQLLRETLDQLRSNGEALAAEKAALLSAWAAQWAASGIEPLPPREMSAWAAGLEQVRFQARDLERIGRAVQDLRTARQKLMTGLSAAAAELGAGFAGPAGELTPLLIFCEALTAENARVGKQREKLLERCQELAGELEQLREGRGQAAEELAQCRGQWERAVAELRPGRPELSPAEAVEVLETLRDCFARRKEAAVLGKRIEGIDRDAREFAGAVAALSAQVAPDLAGLPVEQAVVQMQAMLTRARQDQALLDKYTKELTRARTDAQALAAAIAALEAQMAELLAHAGCNRREELDRAEQLSAEYQRLSEQLASVEEGLLRISGGIGIEELAGQAAAVDPDELPGELSTLTRISEQELGPELKRLSQVIGEQGRELQRMDGGPRAAAAAEDMQRELARISRLTRRYIRVRLAAGLLLQQIERFRAEHQDPVLRIASGYFAGLTLGSFTGLRTDVDERGLPVLVGLRQEAAARVGVEGMSAGTRDQLYLALRLATLAWRLEAGEPMPFIVDDILINFDDARSRATLELLAELAEKNQMLLFTHHRQIVSEANRLATARAWVRVHELDG